MRRCMGCMEPFGDQFQICPHCGYVVGTHAEEAVHMEPGTLLHDRYIVGRVLGYGGFGVTYIGWDGKLEQKVAIKEYLPAEFSTRMPGQSLVRVFSGEKSEQFRDGLKKFVEEAKHLAKFQNESGIVKIFDSFEDNDTAYIIMEYLEGETLTEYLKEVGTIAEDDAIAMMTPVMESLQVVHQEGLLHRDIAPDNIFLTRTGEVKLIDFGASRYATTSHSRSLTVIIKPGYSPEEQYRSRGDQGPHTDVYAVAATLYKMITGKTPPDAMERRAKYENQNKDILVEPHKITKKISINRENAILNAMNVRIEDRTPDMVALLQELNANPPAKRRYGKIKKIDFYTWPMWLKVTVPVLMAVLVVFGTLLGTGVISFSNFTEEIIIPEDVVSVPDVEGMIKDDAITELLSSKLLVSTNGSVESEYVAAGKIILQTPIGGMYMDTNSTVLLTVSSGGKTESPKDGMSTVPYVIWDSAEDALRKLEAAGLGKPTIKEVNDDNVAAGHVITQSIEAGKQVDEGTVLELTVSKGAAAFKMADVQGMNAKEAEKLLTSQGLVVRVEFEKNDDVPEDCIISQSVKANTDVKRGDKITLTVSSGKQTVKVADVKGKPSEEAQSVLEKQGFAVTMLENFDEKVPTGSVISQKPEAGSNQLPGTKIVLYVSKGAQPKGVSVADVVGMSSGEAKSTLKNQGFQVAAYQDYHESAPEGTVYAQNPGGGTSKMPGATIEIYVSLGQPVVSVTVKNVVGKSKSDAVSILEGQDFNVEIKERYDTSVPSGVVISQDPEGGTSRYPDATITVVVSKGKQPVSITFEPNGGSVDTKSATVYLGGQYGSLPTAYRDMHEFTGWYLTPNGSSQVTESTTVTNSSAHTLYAGWYRNAYTLTMDANGGEGSTSRVVKVGSGYGDLPNPSKAHYQFQGWFTDPNGGSQVDSSTKMGEGDVTIYAHWAINTYTLTFNSNGGDSGDSSVTLAYGSQYGSLPDATRAYYDFDGWFTDPSGGSQVSASTTMGEGNVTVYAHWTQHPVSGWVREGEMPGDGQLVEEKWTYTETTTTESKETSLSGYQQISSRWEEIGSDHRCYADFPGGGSEFDHSHWIWTDFAYDPYTPYENETSKREVSNSWSGYVYWHWMYNVAYSHNQLQRRISDRSGCWDSWGNYDPKNYNYKYFTAFTSATNAPYLDNGYCCSRNQASYDCRDIITADNIDTTRVGTPRFFRFEYSTSYYTDYEKVFTYQKTEDKESNSVVSPSDTISNVQRWVRYRAK